MMSEVTIRKFTDEGVDQFRSYLAELKEGSTSPPPFHILNDPATSESLSDEVQIENRNFETRLDLARYLNVTLADIDSDSIETDVYLWSWLSLFYFDQVCPPQKDGVRRPGRDYRHILEPGYPNGHRHLLCGPYMVYAVYELGEDLSKLLLCTDIPIENKFHHELAGRQSLITNRGTLEAVHTLYYEEAADKPKRGAQVKKPTPGSFYRFIGIIQQLDLNYDLYSMHGNEILDLLPPEFNKWKGQISEELS
jgi:hypothetical protein